MIATNHRSRIMCICCVFATHFVFGLATGTLATDRVGIWEIREITEDARNEAAELVVSTLLAAAFTQNGIHVVERDALDDVLRRPLAVDTVVWGLGFLQVHRGEDFAEKWTISLGRRRKPRKP